MKKSDKEEAVNDEQQKEIKLKFNEVKKLIIDKKYNESIKLIDKLLIQYPNVSNGFYIKALALTKLNKYEEALTYFDKAISIKPKENFYIKKAKVLNELNRFNEVIATCNQLLEINKNNEKAYLIKGNALSNMDKFKEALDVLNLGLAIAPNNPNLYYNKAQALKNLGNVTEAVKNFQKVLDFYPNNEKCTEEINKITGRTDYKISVPKLIASLIVGLLTITAIATIAVTFKMNFALISATVPVLMLEIITANALDKAFASKEENLIKHSDWKNYIGFDFIKSIQRKAVLNTDKTTAKTL